LGRIVTWFVRTFDASKGDVIIFVTSDRFIVATIIYVIIQHYTSINTFLDYSVMHNVSSSDT